METQKFKTNIKCMGCIATVTPVLNQLAGEGKWSVDLQDPGKTLSVNTELEPAVITEELKKVGYEATAIS